MTETPTERTTTMNSLKHIGIWALCIGFATALVVFVCFAAILVYQNYELSRDLTEITKTQAEIRAETMRLQKDIERLNDLFIPKAIKKMSLRLQKKYDHNKYRANYLSTLIYTYSINRRLDPYYTFAVIEVESSFKSNAVSEKGAIGLMQVLPAWGEKLGFSANRLFDSKFNISVGTRILRMNIDRHKCPRVALAVYYTGRPTGGEEYIKKVIEAYKGLV